MVDEELSIFKDEAAEVEAAEPPAEEPAQEPEPVAEEPPKAEQPEQEPTAETGEQEAPPPGAEPEKEAPHVPMMAMLDEREKRQNAERELQNTQAQLQNMQRQMQQIQARQQPQQKPDFFENPEATVQAHIQSVRLEQSRFMAEQTYGPELVQEAFAYFEQNPQETPTFLSHPSPFHAAVDRYKQVKFMQDIGNDPEKWMEAERQRIKEEISAQFAAQAPTAPAPTSPPPASLAKAGAGGKPTPVTVNVPETLNGLFNGD